MEKTIAIHVGLQITEKFQLHQDLVYVKLDFMIKANKYVKPAIILVFHVLIQFLAQISLNVNIKMY